MSEKTQRIVAGTLVLLAMCVLCAGALWLFWGQGHETPGRQTVPPVPVPTVTPVPEGTGAPDTDEQTETAPEPVQDAAQARYDEMTQEQRVGQLFFARFPGASAEEEIKAYAPAGYILFGVDFKDETPDTLTARLDALQEKSATPLLFGVDEEGGTVVRASYYSQFRTSKFRSPQQVLADGGMDGAAQDAREKAAFLKNLSLNVNLAPVCDISESENGFMYDRTAGMDADGTAEFVRTVVSATKSAGVGTVLKHFPGYGDNVDTHTGIAVDERGMDSFRKTDFVPFEAGIQAGADSVLVSHNVVTCMDEELPASLSPQVHQVLRKELAFDGVVMTDDLAMGALADYSQEDVAVQAVLAGNDLLISSDFAAQYQAVLAAVQDGRITQERLKESVLRVLRWKQRLGLLP